MYSDGHCGAGHRCEAELWQCLQSKLQGSFQTPLNRQSFVLLSFMRERNRRKYSCRDHIDLSPPFPEGQMSSFSSKFLMRTRRKDFMTLFLSPPNQMSLLPRSISSCKHPLSSRLCLSEGIYRRRVKADAAT